MSWAKTASLIAGKSVTPMVKLVAIDAVPAFPSYKQLGWRTALFKLPCDGMFTPSGA